MNKACFIDRDGVIIEEKHYLSSTDDVEIFPETVEALALLKQHGFMTVIISNQSGVARGYFSEDDIKTIENHIHQELADKGVAIDSWFYCCHHPAGSVPGYNIACDCRKPAPGMLIQAADELSLDLAQSCMIGDKYSDLDAANNAGCRLAVLVRTGHGLDEIAENPERQDVVVDNILDAAKLIVSAPS